MSTEFQEFPKMGRLTRECVITEKIDGTNAQIVIGSLANGSAPAYALLHFASGLWMMAGSRTRWITPGDDNFGFARWAMDHADELLTLGEGRHYGEWWGSGIQRGYGLTSGEKRFSLFNVARWHANGAEPCVLQGADPRQPPKLSTEAPACCSVVPVLARGMFSDRLVDNMLAKLTAEGSLAAPGFMKPEGIVAFHTATGVMFKKTIEKDERPKGKS